MASLNLGNAILLLVLFEKGEVRSQVKELILDLGLNPQPYATGEVTVQVAQRIILNHYTAKRLLSALSMALQRHEQAFGVLETDVRKRVKTQ